MTDKRKYLSPKEVGEMLGLSPAAARDRMREMPGCVNVGSGKYEILRVPVGAVETWADNRILVMARHSGKMARRKNGKLQAV